MFHETLLAGLFAGAIVAATILPAQSELLLAAMLVSGRFDTVLLLAAATGAKSWVRRSTGCWGDISHTTGEALVPGIACDDGAG